MALSEKALKDIQRSLENQNARILKLYRKTGDKDLLDMLYINTDNADELAEEFGISIEEAAELIEKDRKSKENPVETIEKTDSGEDEDCDSDYDDADESRIFHDPLCVIQEALCFIGDVISDTTEKICDALDESVERIMDHDFDE